MDRGSGVRRFGRRLGTAFLDSNHGIPTHDARRFRLDLPARVPPPVRVETAVLSSATALSLGVWPERSLETLVPCQDFHQITGRMLSHVVVDKISYKLWKTFQRNWNPMSLTQNSWWFVGKFDDCPECTIPDSDSKSRLHQTSVAPAFHEIIEEESGVTLFYRLVQIVHFVLGWL